MFIAVSGAFKSLIPFIGKKGYVNLSRRGDILVVQAQSNIITEYEIPLLPDSTIEDGKSITLGLKANFNLINGNDPISISVTESTTANEVYLMDDGYAMIQQGSLVIHAETVTADRYKISKDLEGSTIVSSSIFNELVYMSRCVVQIAKLLGVSESSIDIVDGVAYANYSNISISTETTLPDMSLSVNTLREIDKAVVSGDELYMIVDLEESSLRLISRGKYIIHVTASKPNYRLINGLIASGTRCKKACSTNLPEDQSFLFEVVKLNAKSKIDLHLSDQSIGLVMSGEMMLKYGNIKDGITLSINTSTLYTILKWFGSRRIDVYKEGHTCIIKSGTKQMMISCLIS